MIWMLFWEFFKKYRWEIVRFQDIDGQHVKILAYGFHIKAGDILAINKIGNIGFILGSQEQMQCYRFQVSELTRSQNNPYRFRAILTLQEDDFKDSDKFCYCHKKGRIWTLPFETLCSAIIVAKAAELYTASQNAQRLMNPFLNRHQFFNY